MIFIPYKIVFVITRKFVRGSSHRISLILAGPKNIVGCTRDLVVKVSRFHLLYAQRYVGIFFPGAHEKNNNTNTALQSKTVNTILNLSNW